jgi:hypothetical protein
MEIQGAEYLSENTSPGASPRENVGWSSDGHPLHFIQPLHGYLKLDLQLSRQSW